MQFAKRVLNSPELGFGGFNEEQELFGAFNLSLPTVDRREWSKDVDAGGEAARNQFGCDGVGFLAGEETVVNIRRLSVMDSSCNELRITYTDVVRRGKSHSFARAESSPKPDRICADGR